MPDGWNWNWFFWGCIGAAAPEIVRSYRILIGGTRGRLPKFSFFYFVFSGAYIVFGGLFAVAWAENNAWKCLWIGASLPFIVAALVNQPPTGASAATNQPATNIVKGVDPEK